MAPSIWQILIVLLIVLLLFGTKRLRNVGSDLGAAIKGFRTGMKDGAKDGETPEKLGSDAPEQGSTQSREKDRQEQDR